MGTSGGAAGQAKEWLGGSSDVTSQTPRWRDGAVIWEQKPRHKYSDCMVSSNKSQCFK